MKRSLSEEKHKRNTAKFIYLLLWFVATTLLCYNFAPRTVARLARFVGMPIIEVISIGSDCKTKHLQLFFRFEKLRDPSHNWAYPTVRLEAMMSKAGLRIEHGETISKDMEFEPWADQMGASEGTKNKLRKLLLDDARSAAKEFWKPYTKDGATWLQLCETIIIGRKG